MMLPWTSVGSPTFGQWEAVVLSAQNKRQFWIPEGFAHGFAVLSESALFHYLCTDVYVPEADAGIRWNDGAIAVDWPLARRRCRPRTSARLSWLILQTSVCRCLLHDHVGSWRQWPAWPGAAAGIGVIGTGGRDNPTGRLPDGSACEIADFNRPELLPALLDSVQPSAVVNAAAYTAVDRAAGHGSSIHGQRYRSRRDRALVCHARRALVHTLPIMFSMGRGTGRTRKTI